MLQKNPTISYIDATNLYKGMQDLGHQLDYKKFRVWLSQKFSINTAILFMRYLNGVIKGNADAEIVLQCTRDYFEKQTSMAFIISGDGNFSCLVDFCIEKNIFKTLIIPNRKYCSYLLRKKNISLHYIKDFIHLFNKKKHPR